MITAGVDVGSNTVRLLIADVQNGKIVKSLFSGRGITRLGAGIAGTGRLSEASMDKTIDLFKQFHSEILKYKAEKVFAAATSAVREASNSADFIARAHSVGIPLKAISGDEEAKYTYLGVSATLADLPKSAVVYDIGGGSTEFIHVEKGEIVKDISVPIGVVKLADKYGFDKPTDHVLHEECKAYLREVLAPMRAGMADAHGELIGTAGTVTTIAAVELGLEAYQPEKVNTHKLTDTGIETLLARVAALTPQERIKLPGLEAGREDLMIPGMILVDVIMELFGKRMSYVSDYGLREGLAIAASEA